MEGGSASVVKKSRRSLQSKRKQRSRQKRAKRLKFRLARSTAANVEASAGPPDKPLADIEGEVPGMEKWEELGVPSMLIRGLYVLGFKVPTPIQKQGIAVTLKTEGDIIGAAETGSGKTLAFGIPILMHVLKSAQEGLFEPGPPAAKSGTSAAKTGASVAKRRSGKAVKKQDGGDVSGGVVKKQGGDDVSGGVVDLNHVFHDGELEDSGTVDVECLESDGEAFSGEGEKSTEESPSPPPAKRTKRVRKVASIDSKLVSVVDDIPDVDFERMLEKLFAPPSRGASKEAKVHSDEPVDSKPQCPSVNSELQAENSDLSCGPVALILAPTRELAIQIHTHLTSVARYTNIKICAVVGGMAESKQERLLSHHPSIVVGTVGRVWMLMSQGNEHLCRLGRLRYLVLDEADRMVEPGHYQDLWHIMERLRAAPGASLRRNLLYSATLTVSRRITEQRKAKRKATSQQDVMDKLMKQIGLKENPEVVDLTGSKVMVESLTETKIMCTAEDKDVLLYYFLLRYPGRTVVFVNTIKCLQRLCGLLDLLLLKPLRLHANMQQRQRLKNLDRFNADSRGILIASDVAARGLDFPKVEHVIHYQVPMNTELYVHRSGRTARVTNEGLSLILVSPEDMKPYKNICKTLNEDQNLRDFPVEHAYVKPLRPQVSVARQIHSITFRMSKARKTESWFTRSAQALDVELDEELCSKLGSKSLHQDTAELKRLNCKLDALLKHSVLPQTLSMKYPTREGNHSLLQGYKGLHGRVLLSSDAPMSAIAAISK